MFDFLRDALKFAEELSGANILTIVILMCFLLGYFIYKVAGQQRVFAKRCGVQKQLLVGHVQQLDNLSPSEALLKTNKMTREAME